MIHLWLERSRQETRICGHFADQGGQIERRGQRWGREDCKARPGEANKQQTGKAEESDEMPGPADTVISPVRLEKTTVSCKVGPGFVEGHASACIGRGIGSTPSSPEEALPDKVFERGLQVG